MTQPVNRTAAPLARPSSRHLAPVPERSAWDDYAEDWSRSLRARNLAPLSVKSYLRGLGMLAAYAVPRGCPSPEEADHDLLTGFFLHLFTEPSARGIPHKPSSVEAIHKTLRVFFRWLEDAEEIPSPMRKIPQPKVVKTPPPVYSDDDLRALLKACERDARSKDKDVAFAGRRDLALFRLLIDTGLRRKELAGLEVEHVDRRNQLLTVTGKGGKVRRVPYFDKTGVALDAYFRARAKHKDARLPALWLAAYPRRGALGYGGLGDLVLRRTAEAGLDGTHFLHRFRHTAAHAYLSEPGAHEGDAMELFGWSSREMLDRYGASAKADRAIANARRMGHGDRI
jgi:integrase